MKVKKSKSFNSMLTPLATTRLTLVPGDAGDVRDVGSVPGSERSLGGGPGSPLQYSFLYSFFFFSHVFLSVESLEPKSLTGYSPWVTKSRT